MNTLSHSYRGAFQTRHPRLRADARRWLRSFTTGAAVAYAFAWVPLCVAQSGKNIADLQFTGATATQSTWMTMASIAGEFRLETAQQQQFVDQFTLKAGELHVSVSPFVSSGNGGVHRLFEISGNKDVLVDTQNQKGGVTVDPPPDRPDTGLITAPPPPTSGGGGGSTGGSGSGTGGGGAINLPSGRPDTGLIGAPNRPPTTGGAGGGAGGGGNGTGGEELGVARAPVAKQMALQSPN